MENVERVYRELQRHLDRQPIGFPATKSGAEIRILKRLFSPEHAQLAMYLDYTLSSVEQVHERVKWIGLTRSRVLQMLDEMAVVGAIGYAEKGGRQYYHIVPFVVGIYEYQADRIDPEFMADAGAYFQDRSFGLSFLSTEVPQMRTIPVEKSLTPHHTVTDYDTLTRLLAGSEGPFSVGDCVCRKSARMQGKTCQKTERLETCMALGGMAKPFIDRGFWRQITREEALEIARRNQADGLVLQPSNTQNIEFVCACCGCCCGMLGVLKTLPKPVEFWATNYYARVDSDSCVACKTCSEGCPMGAAVFSADSGNTRVDRDRCIGCGNCVATCPTGAMSLLPKRRETVPPVDLQDMYETIRTHKKGALGKARLAAKLMLKV